MDSNDKVVGFHFPTTEWLESQRCHHFLDPTIGQVVGFQPWPTTQV
jgi:hypothetical protein